MSRFTGLGRASAALLAASALITASLAGPGGVWAAASDIGDAAGPLTSITISTELNCAVNHIADSVAEFYGGTACATLVAVDGTLYGPASIPAGSGAAPRTTFTPVSQSAVTGTGTSGDPFTIVTVVGLGSSGIQLTETDSYVTGDEWYKTNVSLAQLQGEVDIAAIIYRAGDCYLQGSDNGFGAVNAGTGSVSCVGRDLTASGNVPGSRVIQWLPITAGSHYYEAGYSSVWSAIGSQLAFPDTCLCDTYLDNGAGLSWGVTVPSQGSVAVSHLTTFSPTGQTPDSEPTPPSTSVQIPSIGITKSASAANVSAGASVTYTYAVTNTSLDALLFGISVSDDKCAAVAFTGGDADHDGNLQIGETWTYDCTTALASTTTNVATATGKWRTQTVTATASATVTVGVSEVLAATDRPEITLPPTSTAAAAGSDAAGPGLGLVLLVLGGLGLMVGLFSPARVRHRR
jgi:hypothetical protein